MFESQCVSSRWWRCSEAVQLWRLEIDFPRSSKAAKLRSEAPRNIISSLELKPRAKKRTPQKDDSKRNHVAHVTLTAPQLPPIGSDRIASCS